MTDENRQNEARRHAVSLEQCAIFAADAGENIAKAMTDAAAFLRTLDPQTTPAPRVIALKWGHVEKDWIETTNCPFQYSVLLDDEVAKEGKDSAPFMLMLAPNAKLGMFRTMESAMVAAQADLAFRVAALFDPAPAKAILQRQETP